MEPTRYDHLAREPIYLAASSFESNRWWKGPNSVHKATRGLLASQNNGQLPAAHQLCGSEHLTGGRPYPPSFVGVLLAQQPVWGRTGGHLRQEGGCPFLPGRGEACANSLSGPGVVLQGSWWGTRYALHH
jgi:hypothetical protein